MKSKAMSSRAPTSALRETVSAATFFQIFPRNSECLVNIPTPCSAALTLSRLLRVIHPSGASRMTADLDGQSDYLLAVTRELGRSIQTSRRIEQSSGYHDLPAVVKLLEHILYGLANLTPALLGIGP